jgi:hypothetical protein
MRAIMLGLLWPERKKGNAGRAEDALDAADRLDLAGEGLESFEALGGEEIRATEGDEDILVVAEGDSAAIVDGHRRVGFEDEGVRGGLDPEAFEGGRRGDGERQDEEEDGGSNWASNGTVLCARPRVGSLGSRYDVDVDLRSQGRPWT